MKMTETLKSCPFCGSEAEFNPDEFGEGVCCKSCGATLHNGVYGEEGRKLASADWNARPIENELNEKIEKLKAENKRLREALKIYKEALHEGLWKTGLQDSIWEIIEQAEEKAEQILKGDENV